MISVYCAPHWRAKSVGWPASSVSRRTAKCSRWEKSSRFRFLGVGLGEILHQVNQAHHGGVDQGHVLQKGGTVAGKGVQHPLHRLFAALPDGLNLFLGADGLHPPRGLQPGKGDVRLGCLVPPLAGRLAEGLQALLGGLETLPIGFFQGRVLLGQGAGLGHLPGPVGGGVPGLLQQEGPPGGLAHVSDPG